MQPLDYREAIRHRWPLLVALMILGAAIGALLPVPSHKATGASLGFLAPRYRAVSVIGDASSAGSNGSASTPTPKPAQVLAAVHNTAVESAAARTLGLANQAAPLDAAVVLVPQAGTTAQLSATAATPADAAALANAYADALLGYFAQNNKAAQQQALSAAKAQVDTLQVKINSVATKLQSILAGSTLARTDPQAAVLQAQQKALDSAYSSAYQTYTQLSTAAPPGSGLVVVQPAAATAATTLPLPTSSALDQRWVRGLIGAAIGLILAILIALVLEQLEHRIRSRDEAEQAFALPVLAEVPRYRLSGKARDVVVRSAPRSPSAEAYRTLRTVLLAEPGRWGQHAQPSAAVGTHQPGEAVGGGLPVPVGRPSPVAASNGRGAVLAMACLDGERTRSAAVANVAAVFAEQGRSVLVVVADQSMSSSGPSSRRSSKPSASPKPDTEGAGDADTSLATVSRQSVLPGVRHADLATLSPDSVGRLDDMKAVLADARRLADLVIVDAAPVLSAHDAGAVAGMVDAMVLVAESRRSTRDQARRSSEVLARLQAPVRGVLLTQATFHPAHRRRRSAATPSWELDLGPSGLTDASPRVARP